MPQQPTEDLRLQSLAEKCHRKKSEQIERLERTEQRLRTPERRRTRYCSDSADDVIAATADTLRG